MVDSIRNLTNPQKVDIRQIDSNTLRSNFKNLSSGLSVAQAANNQAANIQTLYQHSPKMGKVVDHLKDALKSSEQTLKALEEMSDETSSDETSISFIAKDINELKSDVVELLKTLKQRTETANIMSENISSADSRIEDVQAAQDMAKNMQADIVLLKNEALQAHSQLSSAEVQKLLEE